MKIELLVDGKTLFRHECEAVVPPVIPPVVPPTPPPPVVPPVIQPPVSGEIGSETNPVPLVNIIPGLNYYGYDITTTEYVIQKGQTVWFKADPQMVPAFATKPPKTFKLQMLNYDGQMEVNVSGKVWLINKTTGEKRYKIDLIGSQTGFTDVGSYDISWYYLIALTESGKEDQSMTLRWKGIF